jgi:hypothetical protein
VQLDAFHLPPGFEDVPLATIAERDGVRLRTARLDEAATARLADALRRARARLRSKPLARTIAAVDTAAGRLRDDDEPVRHLVLRSLEAFTGLHPAMARHVLDRISEDWLAPALHRLLTAELGGTDAVDGFIARGDGIRSRVVAPAIGLHVFSGNVPGVSVTSMVRALLVRSAVIGKPAAGEPFLAAAFARLLHEADPLVGDCCAVFYWSGGDAAVEAAVLRHAGLVVHYGGAEAIASLRARAAEGTTFVEHGPRLSLAVVNAAAAGHDAARDLARAVALFDQQGCVSPQAAYVVGSADDARSFAAAVADALAEIGASLPRGRLEPAEAAAIHTARTRAEFRAIGGENVHLWQGASLAYTVIYDGSPGVSGTCLNRTLVVRPVADVQQLIDTVEPAGMYLQTVGIAGFGDEDGLALAAALGEIGATRVAPISAMPWPPVTWHHDGRGPLRELVRWIDYEA